MTVIKNIKDWLDKPTKAPQPRVAAFYALMGSPVKPGTRRDLIADILADIIGVIMYIAAAIAHVLSTLMWIIIAAVVFVWVMTHYPLTNPLIDYCLASAASALGI